MAEKSSIQYDSDAIFISYSPEDIDWAEDELRPRLEKSGVKVITGENLTSGATVSLNRERAIADTQRTIVVLSPEWVADSWNSFEADMLIHLDPAAVKRKLLPVLLRKTDIPPRIARLTVRDLTDPKRYESRLKQLINDVVDSVPPRPRESFPNPWAWYWSRARRLGITPRRLAGAGGLLVAFLLLVFSSGAGWEELPQSPSKDRLNRLYAGNGLLLAASDTDTGQDAGLWRSVDGAASWQDVGGFLNMGSQRASVRDFAATQTTIFAATLGVGLWRAGLDGEAWVRLGEDQLPTQLHRISTSPDGAILLVSSVTEGVYLSVDAGLDWARVDGEQGCGSPSAQNLPMPMTEAAVLVNGDGLLVGAGGATRIHSGLYESQDGGVCWEIVHGQKDGPAQMGNEYLALAALPSTDDVLVLYYDHDAPESKLPTQLITLNGANLLWQPQSNKALSRIVVVPGSPDRWYVAGIDGAIVSDTVPRSAQETTQLPSLRSCLILLCEPVDFAVDSDGQTRLLLTWRKLYRWGTVPGYRVLWP